jgi:hypothetical protein
MTTFPAGLLHSIEDKQSKGSLFFFHYYVNDVCGAID